MLIFQGSAYLRCGSAQACKGIAPTGCASAPGNVSIVEHGEVCHPIRHEYALECIYLATGRGEIFMNS